MKSKINMIHISNCIKKLGYNSELFTFTDLEIIEISIKKTIEQLVYMKKIEIIKKVTKTTNSTKK